HEIRRHPLAPHARELTFPDRSSFAVVRATAWLQAPLATREAVAQGFLNDSYWFDQAACSSPRTVFWVGPRAGCDAARADFVIHLSRAVKQRGWAIDAATAVEKRVAAYELAADLQDDLLARVTTVGAPRRWLGTGTFAHARLGSLAELVPLVSRRDQTMTPFGFTRDELMELAHALAGRGVGRMVPFCDALEPCPPSATPGRARRGGRPPAPGGASPARGRAAPRSASTGWGTAWTSRPSSPAWSRCSPDTVFAPDTGSPDTAR